jgi:hypothetical protein
MLVGIGEWSRLLSARKNGDYPYSSVQKSPIFTSWAKVANSSRGVHELLILQPLRLSRRAKIQRQPYTTKSKHK